MFKNVLMETASTRAHSAILNTLEIEVITRRDTAVTVYDKAYLRMYTVARKAFADSWDILMPHVDSISYAVAWDKYYETSRRKKNVIETVNEYIELIFQDIAADLEAMFPISSMEEISGAERALSEIVGVENRNNLLALV